MTATFEWGDAEHTVIHIAYQGRWTWSEVHQTQAEIHELIRDRDDAVNYIVTWDNENWIPGGISENLGLLFDRLRSVPNIGLVVIVSTNALFEPLIRLFIRLTGKPPFEFAFADSVEEAYILLEPAQV
ncbi:MAG: hypothetical protein K8J31_03710 [Anaerolineae bacterium]|nr:hypothetical protein [Anaerolineae bacterium]